MNKSDSRSGAKGVPFADKAKPPKPLRNDVLKAEMEELRKTQDREQYVKVLNEVVNAQLLIPIQMDRKPEVDAKSGEVILDKDTEIRFEIIENNKGELYYPVFTDGEEMKKLQLDKDQQVLIVSFGDLAAMLRMQADQMAGFVINPKGTNMVFPAGMVSKMAEEMEETDKKSDEETDQ